MSQVANDELLEQWTREAVDAAKHGRWDQVVQLYDRRKKSGILEKVSSKVAQKLIPYDRWMMTRIREVQALTQQHLGEAQNHRRKLEALKRRWVGNTDLQVRYRLSI